MKKFKELTLSSNGKTTIIPIDNIAFVARCGENDQNFTRVFLKEIADDEAKFVDVKEEPNQII